MWGDARMAARRLAWERLARSLLSCVSSSHRSNSVGPNRSRGSISRTVDLRPRDPGHLFPPKPVAGSAEKLRPAGTGPRGDASQPRCGSRTRPCRFSPSQTPFLYADGSLPRMPGSPTGLRSIGQVVAGFLPGGSGGRRPSGFRRACACWSVE